MTSSVWHGIIYALYTAEIFSRDASKHVMLCRIERGTRWWRSHAATIDSFADMDSWSWKIMEFPKNWPLICNNLVKYWPRTTNNTTNREYSARAICWSFPQSSKTFRLETPRGGGGRTLPPVQAKVAKHRIRARVNPRPTGGGAISSPPRLVFLRYLLNRCRYHRQTCSTLSPNIFTHCVKILKSRVS